jgi:uncharacterized protein (DUF111 family)
MNEIMMVLKQYNCTIVSQEMQLFCVIKAGVPKNRTREVLYQLKELQSVDVQKSP